MSAICRIFAAALLAIVLVACEDETSDTPETQSIFPDIMAERRAECEASGGRWGPAANKTIFVCFRNLPDANKPCRAEGDCQGFCLARSRTCTPIEPFYGCHQVLSSGGLPQTVGVE